jgi:hypothetical protein
VPGEIKKDKRTSDRENKVALKFEKRSGWTWAEKMTSKRQREIAR